MTHRMTARGVRGSAVVMERDALLIPPFDFISCHDCHLTFIQLIKGQETLQVIVCNVKQSGQSAVYGNVFIRFGKLEVMGAGEEKKFEAFNLPS